METFSLPNEQRWDPQKHVESILGQTEGGDYSIACWEPGQISPHHSHPECTEIYLCISGKGVMSVPGRRIDIVPGALCVHPPGELHEYANGDQRTVLFRVRYGGPTTTMIREWRGNANWQSKPEDITYFSAHPQGEVLWRRSFPPRKIERTGPGCCR